jgi:DNA-binding MarR family transcriptional regulator
VLQAFRSVSSRKPTGYAATFLAVASKPGQGAGYYAEQLKMKPPAAPRILLETGKKTRTGGKGLELVDSSPGETDLRAINYFLTGRGKRPLAKVVAALSKA